MQVASSGYTVWANLTLKAFAVLEKLTVNAYLASELLWLLSKNYRQSSSFLFVPLLFPFCAVSAVFSGSFSSTFPASMSSTHCWRWRSFVSLPFFANQELLLCIMWHMNLSDQKLMFVKLVPKLESVRGKKHKTKQQKQKPTNNNVRNYDKIYSPLSHCPCIIRPCFTLPPPPPKKNA